MLAISARKKWFYTNGHQSQVFVLDNLALNTKDQYFIETQNALKIAGQVEQKNTKVRGTNYFKSDGATEITQSNDVFYTRSPIELIEPIEPIESALRISAEEPTEQEETPYNKETIDYLNLLSHQIDVSNDYLWEDK